ncbi:MAG: acyl carrier protein [Clostridia bacterium]|nr:acyl carrier protein [Clostridia bacterium]
MVFETLVSIIAENISVDENDITYDTTLEDLGVDYIDLLDIVMALEEALGGVEVEIDDDAETVGELAESIERQL